MTLKGEKSEERKVRPFRRRPKLSKSAAAKIWSAVERREPWALRVLKEA
jgi:hypothetical protein